MPQLNITEDTMRRLAPPPGGRAVFTDTKLKGFSVVVGRQSRSFYAQRDAYPFGRFRLATVLPGGEIVHALPSTEGVMPRDWVALWPPQILEKGTVDYLVNYATSTTPPQPRSMTLRKTRWSTPRPKRSSAS